MGAYDKNEFSFKLQPLIYFHSAHVDNEMCLSKALEKLGANALSKDQENDIGGWFRYLVIFINEP